MNEEFSKGKNKFSTGGTSFVVDSRYEFIKEIGHGAYGVVVSALDHQTGTKVAIKKISNAFEDLIYAKRLIHEIKLLSFFDHENTISLLDIMLPPKRTGYNDIYIVTDLMDTDLRRIIHSKQALSNEHIQYFMYQILRGILYAHSANIIHKDIKPSNILLNEQCDLKICDLGLACEYDMYTDYVVNRWYRAPEILLNSSQYTEQIDVWSIGCVFSELLGGNPLFPGTYCLDMVKKIIAVLGTPSPEDMQFIENPDAKIFISKLAKKEKEKWSTIYPKANSVALDLIDKMLVFNPLKRWSVKQCLEHPYFNGLHNPDEEPLASTPFDWSFDNFEPTKDTLQNMVYEEALKFHPV
ncbi:hypothetical protein SteCoe_22275 [Stentor coeruleus]|uniref:Protein kinase domain-containing protein n=1 Tax=Stentor coeruleus TaxID=5963 RepID=A0A1R2BMM8_9CILI|nr:hypothetical protein SteCoe_22275 [Stentor coeruleus]